MLPSVDLADYIALLPSDCIPNRVREREANGRVPEQLRMEGETRQEEEACGDEEDGLEPPRRRQRTEF